MARATGTLANTRRAHAAHLKRALRKIQFGSKQKKVESE
jgi:hypothetical protein